MFRITSLFLLPHTSTFRAFRGFRGFLSNKRNMLAYAIIYYQIVAGFAALVKRDRFS